MISALDVLLIGELDILARIPGFKVLNRDVAN